MSKYIIDISHWHPVTDWAKAKEISHCLISKGTQGTDFVDETLKSFVTGCEKYKIPYWLYAFPEKGIEVKSIEYFLKTVKPLVGDYLVGYAMDVETYYKKVNGKKVAYLVNQNGAIDALKLLKSQGYKTMLYTMKEQYENFESMIKNMVDDDCAWWEARYGKNDGNYPDLTKYPIHNCDLHQYTSAKTFSCFSGGVDVSKVRESVSGKKLAWYTTTGKLTKQATNDKTSNETSDKEGDSMTEAELRKRVATWPNQFKGIKEGSTEHKKILSIFNGSGLCTRYKMTTSDPWCATTVSAAFIDLGLAGKAGSGSLCEFVECACGNMIEKAKAQGIWTEADGVTPKVADVIMYDWDDTKGSASDDTGWPEHVGIVQGVSNGVITVIEGNKNDSVDDRQVKVNGRYIRGYIQPDYAKFATKSAASKTTTGKTYTQANKGCYLPKLPSRGWLQQGDKSTEVVRLKKFLNWYLGTKLTITDPNFGPKTKTAVIKFQKAVGITQDGEFGKVSLSKAKVVTK